jgi:CMP-N-acetylneuraminic acid synthetase
MILAVIPARGGSKRLPGKNLAPFGGRPLLAWSVALAKRCPRIVRCVVSTEDPAIAAAAIQAGADVIDRPPELAGDESSITEVLIHAAATARDQGTAFDAVMLLQPTNPLRPVATVERAIDRFAGERADSLITVSGRALKTGRLVEGRFVPSYVPDTQSRRTAPTFYENGLLYITRSDILFDQRSIYGTEILGFETEAPFDQVDIDEAVDLEIGEAILGAVRGQLGYAP